MPTPMAHMMVGGSIGFVMAPKPALPRVMAWVAVGALIAALPDLDILAVLLGIDWSRAHRTVSHSIVTAVSLSAVVLAIRDRRTALLTFVILASHLMMDLFCQDVVPPYGVCIFWPFSESFVYFDTYLFPSLLSTDRSVLPWAKFLSATALELFLGLTISVAVIVVWGRQRARAMISRSSCRRKTFGYH